MAPGVIYPCSDGSHGYPFRLFKQSDAASNQARIAAQLSFLLKPKLVAIDGCLISIRLPSSSTLAWREIGRALKEREQDEEQGGGWKRGRTPTLERQIWRRLEEGGRRRDT
jgi:hypothetical protein